MKKDQRGTRKFLSREEYARYLEAMRKHGAGETSSDSR